MTTSTSQLTKHQALGLLGFRVVLVAVATVSAWLIAVSITPGAQFPPSPQLASLALLPVNLITLWLVSRALRAKDSSLRELFAPRKGKGALADLGWGLLWISVLYIPFVGAVIATMWLLHGADMFTAFQTVFFNPDAASVANPTWALILGIIAVATFAPLNAPAEEALYRGQALTGLKNAWSRTAAVAITSVSFGLQHAFFAPSPDAMIVYVVAFTVWGAGSALIVLKQQRLMPITIAHFIVNLMTSSPAVILPALQLAGVVPV